MQAIIPIPRCALTVRPATVGDIQFMDDLQKMHQHMVGWTPRKTFEGKIAAGHVLVAEQNAGVGVGAGVRAGRDDNPNLTLTPNLNLTPSAESPSPQPSPRVQGEGVRVGYCISQDRYMG